MSKNKISNGVKKVDYRKIRNKVINFVKQVCYSKKNKYSDTVWPYHLMPVVKYSLKLGKKLKADLEVLELAAYLHDLSALVNIKTAGKHHLVSAQIAEKLLKKWQLPEEKITRVKECILSHRGSINIKPKNLEAKILASADAMSHFSQLADMMYLTYGIHKFKTRPGAIWLKNKLLRSWRKIMPAGKKLIKKDYQQAMKILDQAVTK